jgi:CreA protein
VFSERLSLIFKSLAVRRIYEKKNTTLIYVIYSRQVQDASAITPAIRSTWASALVPSITFAEDSPTARGWAIGCYNRVCLAVDGAGHSKHLDLNNNKNVFAGPDFKGEPPFAISCENTGYCAIVDAKGRSGKPASVHHRM